MHSRLKLKFRRYHNSRTRRILNAEGNVIVQFGKSKAKAKALNFNQKTKEIKFTEIQEFQDGTTFMSAENAVISSDLSDGIMRH